MKLMKNQFNLIEKDLQFSINEILKNLQKIFVNIVLFNHIFRKSYAISMCHCLFFMLNFFLMATLNLNHMIVMQ